MTAWNHHIARGCQQLDSDLKRASLTTVGMDAGETPMAYIWSCAAGYCAHSWPPTLLTLHRPVRLSLYVIHVYGRLHDLHENQASPQPDIGLACSGLTDAGILLALRNRYALNVREQSYLPGCMPPPAYLYCSPIFARPVASSASPRRECTLRRNAVQ